MALTIYDSIKHSSLVTEENFVSIEKTIYLSIGAIRSALDGQKSIPFGIEQYYFSSSRTGIKLLIPPDHDWHINPPPLLLRQRRTEEANGKTCNKCNLFGKVHGIPCQIQ
jgi:hypothetical protein